VRSAVVLNRPLVQGNPVNYFGAIISIAVLLAVPRVRTTIKKTSVLVGTQIGMKLKSALLLVGVQIKSRRTGISSKKKLAQNIEVEAPIEQKVQLERQSPTKRTQTEKLKRPKKLQKPSSGLRTLSNTANCSDERRLSQEIPAECLTCANLLSCNYRQNKMDNSEIQVQKQGACRFATELSINESVAS
jgi:hypothetical protein